MTRSSPPLPPLPPSGSEVISFFFLQGFYAAELDEDEKRVTKLFNNAPKNGIQIQQKSCFDLSCKKTYSNIRMECASFRSIPALEFFHLASRPGTVLLVLVNQVSSVQTFYEFLVDFCWASHLQLLLSCLWCNPPRSEKNGNQYDHSTEFVGLILLRGV